MSPIAVLLHFIAIVAAAAENPVGFAQLPFRQVPAGNADEIKAAVLATASGEKKPAIVFVTRTSCPVCKQLLASIEASMKASNTVNELMQKFVAVSLLEDSAQDWKAGRGMPEEYVPRVYFLGQDGSYLDYFAPRQDHPKYAYSFWRSSDIEEAMTKILQQQTSSSMIAASGGLGDANSALAQAAPAAAADNLQTTLAAGTSQVVSNAANQVVYQPGAQPSAQPATQPAAQPAAQPVAQPATSLQPAAMSPNPASFAQLPFRPVTATGADAIKQAVLAAAAGESKPAIVFVTRKTCPVCQGLLASIDASMQASNHLSESMNKFVAVNLLEDSSQDWKSGKGVPEEYVPRVYFLSAGGEYLDYFAPRQDNPRYAYSFWRSSDIEQAMDKILQQTSAAQATPALGNLLAAAAIPASANLQYPTGFLQPAATLPFAPMNLLAYPHSDAAPVPCSTAVAEAWKQDPSLAAAPIPQSTAAGRSTEVGTIALRGSHKWAIGTRLASDSV